MAVIIPQVVTEDRASGAQVIDGSLLFEDGKSQYLKRTAGSGNQKTYTFSTWIKRGVGAARIFGDYHNPNYQGIDFSIRSSDDAIEFHNYNGSASTYVDQKISSDKFRDTGWYHAMFIADTTQSASEDKFKIYVNGRRITSWATNTVGTATNGNTFGNTAVEQRIGYNYQYSDQTLTQTYFLDGIAAGPEEFGYTDPLTNTWRPKKYTGTFTGTNTFYLPFNGNSPIGQDQSGNGNDWTPVNFGGSTDITKATGAKPILNTLGGTIARSGVFGSEVSAFYATTSASNVGGQYVFEGLGTRPNFSFVRGATYTFDWSASSSHPLRFATAADAAGSTEYTDGTSVSGNVTTITVPHNAPDTLYYYCNVHNGMGNSISVTTDETKADPYAWKCVFASPLIGNDDDVSNQINCTSTTKATTTSGASADFSDSNFYGGSYVFDGSNDYVKTDANTADFNFGSGEFTIECWFNTDGANSKSLFSLWNYTAGRRSWNLYIAGNGDITLITSDDGSGNQTDRATISESYYASNMWNHVAIVRSGNTYNGFINGQLVASTSGSNTIYNNTNDTIYIGCTNGVTEFYDGHIQDVRIYKGVAKYTSNFIPASTNPDILPDTPSGVATKTQLTKITDGAVAFDGTNDNLTISAHSDLDLSSGDFTVEGFVYPQRSQEQSFVTNWNSGGQFQVQMSSSGTLQASWAPYSTSQYAVTGTTPIRVNSWSHFAYTRSGNTFELFLDGISQGTQTSSANGSTNNNIVLGENGGNGDRDLQGFLSNVRIIKGTALYTSNFTPPTRKLINVTNTKLLCCQSVAEQQNNFIRMFLSDTLYTTKADILANATEVDDGESGISNKYWYIVPTGDEPIGSDVFTNDGSVTTPHGSNHFCLLWRNGSSWTKTAGTYNSSEYSDFDYKSDDASSNYSVYPARDFYVFGVDDGSPAPELISGTLPTRAKYYKFDGAVKPGAIKGFGNAKSTNFNPFNTDINTVRGQETGYCTWNPLTKSRGNLLDGNLLFYGDGTNTPRINGTISQSSGKWYYEATVLNDGPGTGSGDVHNSIGWGLDTVSNIETAPNNSSMQHSFYFMDSGYYKNFSGSNTNTSTGKWLAGDVIGVAADLDNNILTFYKNGFEMLSQTIGTTAGTSLCPAHQSNTGTYGRSISNFGQKPFKFTPPDGFQPLTSSAARPDTVITRSDQYVKATIYSGNGASTPGGSGGTQTINVGFKPDLIWIKDRSEAHNNNLIDSINGAPNLLMSDLSDGLTTNSTDGLTAITDNGFTLGDNGEGTQSLEMNKTGNNYVAWTWKAGGGKVSGGGFFKDDVEYASAAAAGLTAGTITPDAASVGTKQGFSIIKYSLSGSSAQTIPHGLDGSLGLLITKATTTTNGWAVWHSSIGDTQGLVISGTNAASSVTWWDQSNMTNNVFAHKAGTTSQSGAPIIAYCWHDVPGLQKFGTYTGNSSSNGPVIDLGFRPALILLKKIVSTDSNSGWHWYDNKRNTYNPANNFLLASAGYYENRAQNNTANVSTYTVDFLSNGFKLSHGSNNLNSSGATYIYAAWAEAPAFNLYGAQSNAR